jgi:DNA-binding MarR family transcriptional regulator
MGVRMQLSDRIGRRLKLHDLHVLMTVAQAGSMGKAAQLLNTTQPAISRSIAELEHALGVRLLDRNRQGVEPTAYGRALLDRGAAVFDANEPKLLDSSVHGVEVIRVKRFVEILRRVVEGVKNLRRLSIPRNSNKLLMCLPGGNSSERGHQTSIKVHVDPLLLVPQVVIRA